MSRITYSEVDKESCRRGVHKSMLESDVLQDILQLPKFWRSEAANWVTSNRSLDKVLR